MGGKGSGITKKRRRLPRKRREGALARLDGRAAEVRFVRHGVEAIAADRGGEDQVSFLARRTAERTMHLDALLMRDEAALAAGQPVDLERYLSGSTTWLRYVQALGLSRVARRVTSLAEIAHEGKRK